MLMSKGVYQVYVYYTQVPQECYRGVSGRCVKMSPILRWWQMKKAFYTKAVPSVLLSQCPRSECSENNVLGMESSWKAGDHSWVSFKAGTVTHWDSKAKWKRVSQGWPLVNALNNLSSALLCHLLSDPYPLKFMSSSPGRGILELWAEHCLGVRCRPAWGSGIPATAIRPLGARGFALMNSCNPHNRTVRRHWGLEKLSFWTKVPQQDQVRPT